MQMRAKLSDLEFKARKEEPEPVFISGGGGSGAKLELDIRGRRVEDGLSELTSFLDAAFLANMPWVRIIHGKGTGRLRAAVRKALKNNKHILSWEEGKDGEGGAGVTVAKFVE
jgi:DNA mismatch repair protein MutS2